MNVLPLKKEEITVKTERAYKLRLDRMAFIDGKIKRGMKRKKLVSSAALAKEYEISRKTIIRDISYMRDMLDAPLEYDKHNHGWYYTESSFKLQHISLSESDLFAMCIAEKVLEQYEGTPIYNSLRSIFEKITSSLPPQATAILPEFASGVSMISFPAVETDGETWKVIFDALKANHTLRIQYQKPTDKQPAWRTIDPYHAVNHHGFWYIMGKCHNSDTTKTFNLARIKKAKPTNNGFSVPDDFDAEKLLRESFDMYLGREAKTVKVQFLPKAVPYIKERVWHPTQSIEERKDGSIIFAAEVNNLTGIIPWIFSWGSNARILAPKELIDEFRNLLNKLVGNYPS